MDIMVGFVVGVMVVAPVGPISLLLITIGLERGAGAGVRAGLGVAAADAALLLVVLAAADRLTALDPTWQRGIEVALGLGLVLIGIRAVAARAGRRPKCPCWKKSFRLALPPLKVPALFSSAASPWAGGFRP